MLFDHKEHGDKDYSPEPLQRKTVVCGKSRLALSQYDGHTSIDYSTLSFHSRLMARRVGKILGFHDNFKPEYFFDSMAMIRVITNQSLDRVEQVILSLHQKTEANKGYILGLADYVEGLFLKRRMYNEEIGRKDFYLVMVTARDDSESVDGNMLASESVPSPTKEEAKQRMLKELKKGANPMARVGLPYIFDNTFIHTHISNMMFETAEVAVQAIQEYNSKASRKFHFETKDVLGKTVLQMAVMVGSIPLVKTLLEAGADPNTIDFHNSTPLHKACCRGNLEMVKLLVQYGARHDVVDDRNMRPAEYANGNEAWVKSLLKSIDIDPQRRYNAKRSGVVEPIPEDRLSYVCVHGKEGELGFEGHQKVRDYLYDLSTSLKTPFANQNADNNFLVLKHITGTGWDRVQNAQTGSIVYISKLKVPNATQKLGVIKEGIAQKHGEEIADGFKVQDQRISIEAASLTYGVRDDLIFSQKFNQEVANTLDMRPIPITSYAYEMAQNGLKSLVRSISRAV